MCRSCNLPAAIFRSTRCSVSGATESERRLDEHQARAVAARRNVVVAAGAGSGKTTVLARRYLELVRDRGVEVSAILTLTFTRKAANEMHERIYRLLLEARDHPLVARAVEEFAEARISILDSFCLQIARERSDLFGLPPGFGIDDATVRRSARDAAIDFMVAHGDDDRLRAYVRINGFTKVLDHLFASIASDYLSVADELDFRSMLGRQLTVLEADLEAACRRITGFLEAIRGIDSAAGASVATVLSKTVSLERVGELYAAAAWNELADLVEAAKPRRPNSNAKKPELLLLREVVDDYLSIRDQTVAMAATMADADLIGGVMELCAEFQNDVLERRRESGLCSYADVVGMAVAVLKHDLVVRDYFKSRFDHIMIDEFQDNNSLQRDLLFLLAERSGCGTTGVVPDACDLDGGKLFFVGDQKQSIYRFRGADVSVFKRLSQEITGAGGESVTLPVNYRSAPGLIALLNGLFSRVMADSSADYEADFEELSTRAARDGEEAELALYYRAWDDDADPESAHSDDAEAHTIVTLIDELVGKKRIPDESGGTRPIAYGDIALLMRSTSNQIRYERAFRNAGVPYTVESARSLFIESIFNDFYSLLQLVVYPRDRFAYLTLLRSPLAAVGDDAAVRLLLDSRAAFEHDEATIAALSAAERDRYDAAAAIYRSTALLASSSSIADTVSSIWYEHGYRYHLLVHPEYHAYLEHYDYLRALAVASDARGETLVEFVDFLRGNLGQYERLEEVEILRPTGAGVRIMTVHKSKGLEFPVVIFANTGNRGSAGRDSSAPYYLSDELGLTVNVARDGRKNYFYLVGKQETEAKELAELKRLAYVACTRAQYRLYITGCHNRQNRTSSDVHLNMLLRGLGWDGASPVEECESLKPFLRPIPDVSERELYVVSRPMRKRDPAAEHDVYRDSPLIEYPIPLKREWTATEVGSWMRDHGDGAAARGETVSRPETTVGSASDPELDSLLERPGDEALFGTLCHAILAARLEARSSEAANDRPRRVIELAGRRGEDVRTALFAFEARVREAIEAKATALCERTLEELSGFLESARIEVEVPFTMQVSETVRVRGQIDCIVVGGDSVAVLDFKTDRSVHVDEYRHQLELYRRAVSSWYDGAVKTYLVSLRTRRLIEVEDQAELEFPWTAGAIGQAAGRDQRDSR
jgi:ATP-dependent exoDNAse (exonuclease V) beta subunit